LIFFDKGKNLSIMNKNKTDDKILKDLVEKLKKEEKPS